MNSIFKDIPLSSYYDNMIENVDSKFVDLVFSIRKIDDRIRKGKAMDAKVGMFEKEYVGRRHWKIG